MKMVGSSAMVGPQLDDNDAKYTTDGLVRTNHSSLSFTRFSCIVLFLEIGKRASICSDRLRRTKEENKSLCVVLCFGFDRWVLASTYLV
jgi:hypothetical protein